MGNLTKEIIERFRGRSKKFVETGTFLGTTIDNIKGMRVFDEIHSVELNDRFYERAKEKYASDKSITIYHGDSVDFLRDFCLTLDTPAVFWLDAHKSGDIPGGMYAPAPILFELENIDRSPVKTHTIMIDDVRLFGSIEWGFLQQEPVIKRIMKINPDYVIEYIDGTVPRDILVAYVPVVDVTDE